MSKPSSFASEHVPQARRRNSIRARFAAWTDIDGADKAALITLFGLNLIDELDRLAFATLTPEIRDAFALTDAEIVAVGALSSTFVLLAAIPVGYMADRYSRVRMAKIAAFGWGAMTLLTAGAWAVPVLFAARFFGGVAKTSNDIVHTGLLTDYYEPRSLPRVFQIHRLANTLSLLGSVIAGVIGLLVGWRWAFVAFALPAFLMLPRLRRLQEPPRGAMIDRAAAERANSAHREPFFPATMRLLRIRTLRRIWVGFFVFGIGVLALVQMLSLFFEDVYGFGPIGRGFVSLAFGVGSVIGILAGGNIGSRYTKVGDFASLTKVVAAGFLLYAVGIMAVGAAPWAILSLASAAVASSGIGLMTPILPTVLMRVLPPHIRGQGHSFSLLAVALGGIFAVSIAGLGEDIGYRWTLFLLGAVMVVTAPIVWSAHRFLAHDVALADESLTVAAHSG